jgi:hypothetical protein
MVTKELTASILGENSLLLILNHKVKQSRYTPWRRLGGEEI